jgi:hypothetical protein
MKNQELSNFFLHLATYLSWGLARNKVLIASFLLAYICYNDGYLALAIFCLLYGFSFCVIAKKTYVNPSLSGIRAYTGLKLRFLF